MIKLNGVEIKLEDVAKFAHENSLSHIEVKLQSGPIHELVNGGERGIDGVQIDDVIEMTKNIIEGFNIGYPCRENSIAVTKLDEALLWLVKRKMDREKRGVEGLNKE